MIDQGKYEVGDRLPTIADMARSFQVGAPTLREALRKLQSAGVITVRHGAGIFVAQNHDALFVKNPVSMRKPSKKVMLDMIQTRLAVEPYTAGLAAENATAEQLDRMESILDETRAALDIFDDATLAKCGLAFHREIALASHNGVMSQLLELLSGLFQTELYAVLNIYGNTETDYQEHCDILDAITKRNRELAVTRMRNHLTSVYAATEYYYETHREEFVQ